MNRLRLKIDSKITENTTLHIEPRYYFLIKSESFPLAGASSLDQLVIDRLYVKTKLPSFSVTAGKQRIAWGTGYLWNPTDIFNPFVLSFAVKEEERTNVEAVRVEVPLGEAGGVDGYVLVGSRWNSGIKGIRGKGHSGMFDYSLSYVDQGTAGFQLGGDAAGELFGAGVRTEIALKSPSGANGYLQSVWGWDYTFENGVGLNLEYYFNGLGKKNLAEYDWAGLYAGRISQLAKDYLFFGANRLIDELTAVRGSLIMNLDDQSWIFYPQYSRSVAQNLDVSVEALLSGGQIGAEFYPGPAEDPTGLGGSKLILMRIIYGF